MSARLRINLACDAYDRTEALRSGDVRVDGIDLNYLALPVEETFHRMIRYREFDAAEMSLSSYTLLVDRGEAPFVAIPVFPSRAFRHNAIYVNESSGITGPGDLVGRTVGVPEYQMTAAVWIRGILAEHHGVPVESVTYRTGGLHQTGRVEKLALDLGPDIRVDPIADDQTLARMLVEGQIDALYTARTPAPYFDPTSGVRRLFEDPKGVEQAYFQHTGVFPIMHVIVVRRDVYEANRWVARSLMSAFEESKRRAVERLRETVSLSCSLPWLVVDCEETVSVMGADFWPYGVDASRATLATFLRYSFEQRLARHRLQPEDLFAVETLSESRV